MIEAQLLVPGRDYPDHGDMWAERVALYARILKRHGVRLDPVRWTEAGPRSPTLACLVWGYHLDAARWLALLDSWPPDVPIANAAPTLGWNSDKRYPDALARAGVAAVPTMFAAIADAAALADARAAFGTDELVVKPRLSASAWRTERAGVGQPAPDLPDAMIQPFLPAVAEEGELSLIYFGGRFSHAFAKVAAAGDFRVQREFGGAFRAVEPDAEAFALAEAAMAGAPVAPVYARADLIRLPHGRLAVMELELIEPDFYLDLAPTREDAFGAAVAAALRMD